MSTDLLGIWKSADKRESRCVYVHRTDAGFAYAIQCSPNGMRLPKARETRIRLTPDGRGVQRYRRLTASERGQR